MPNAMKKPQWTGTVVADFLGGLETMPLDKSYQIPVILSFVSELTVRCGVTLEMIAQKMMDFYYTDSVLQQDLRDRGDWQRWQRDEFARLALDHPIQDLIGANRFFYYDEVKQVLSLDEALHPFLTPALAEHVQDIMEFRKLEYIRKSYGDFSYALAEAAGGRAEAKPVKIYNKLVRDRIPAIRTAEGKRCEIREISRAEYLEALDQKLLEELDEYIASGALEELVDVAEVVRALVLAKGASLEEFEAMRCKKAEERGGFEGKTWLVKTY